MNRLSKNIKNLRKYMGETQEGLAYSIGLDSKSAVANWESGANKPSPDNLKKIADHYRVTVDQLLEDDFSTDFTLIESINHYSEDGNDELIHSIVCLFPIMVFKDEEELYPRLVDAKELYKKFLHHIKNKDEKFYDYLVETLQVYDEIREKSNCISAEVNEFSIYLLFILLIKLCGDTEGLEDILIIKNKNKRKKEIKRFITEDFLSRSQSGSDTLRVFVSEGYYKDLLKEILVLKGDKRLFQLGDYYYCLLYFFDLVDNELGTAVNTQIGIALFSDLSLMKNRYVKRLKNLVKVFGKVQ